MHHRRGPRYPCRHPCDASAGDSEGKGGEEGHGVEPQNGRKDGIRKPKGRKPWRKKHRVPVRGGTTMQDRAAVTLLLNLSLPTATLALSKPLPLARSMPRTVKPPCLEVDETLSLGPFSLVSFSSDTAVVSVSTVPERNKQSGVGPSSIPLPCSPCLHASILPRFPSNFPSLLVSSCHSWSSFLGSFLISFLIRLPSRHLPSLLLASIPPACQRMDSFTTSSRP